MPGVQPFPTPHMVPRTWAGAGEQKAGADRWKLGFLWPLQPHSSEPVCQSFALSLPRIVTGIKAVKQFAVSAKYYLTYTDP